MRKARERAESGVYQILLKGNNRLLFIEDADYNKFLEILASVAARDFMEVYAYCLFEEDINIAIKEGLNEFSRSIKNIVSTYAVWFNAKYGQSGKLFFDRFASLPIECDALQELTRYIHRLPLARKKPLGYEFSSYNNYIRKSGIKSDALMLLFGDSLLEFRLYNDEDAVATFLGVKKEKLTDEALVLEIRKLLGGVDISALGGEDFKRILCEIKKIDGVSLRQIARLLGVSKSTVGYCVKKQ